MRKFFKAVLMTSLLLTPVVGFSSAAPAALKPYTTLMPAQQKQVDHLTFILEQKKVDVRSIIRLVRENPGITVWKNQQGLDPLTLATDLLYAETDFYKDPSDLTLAVIHLANTSPVATRRTVLLGLLNKPYTKRSFDFAEHFVEIVKYNPHLITLNASQKGSVLANNLEKLKKAFSHIDPAHAVPGFYSSLTEAQTEQVDHLTSLIAAVPVNVAEITKLIDANPSLMKWRNKRRLDPFNQAVDLLWYDDFYGAKPLLRTLAEKADMASKLEALYWLLGQQKPFSELGLESVVLVAYTCKIDPATIKIHESQKETMFAANLRRVQEAYAQIGNVKQISALINAKNPDITAIKKYVDRKPTVVNYRNEDGATPLFTAVYRLVYDSATTEPLKNIVTYLSSKTRPYLVQEALIDLLHYGHSERAYEVMQFFVKTTGLLPSAIRADQGSGAIFEKNLRRLQEGVKPSMPIRGKQPGDEFNQNIAD
jgi:hypothetical protein